MTNGLCLALYSPFVLVVLILLGSALTHRHRGRLQGPFLLYIGNLLGWLVMELLYFVLKTPTGIRFVMDIKLCFVAFAAAGLFLLVAGFYRRTRFFTWRFYIVLFALPVVTTLLALTTFSHSLITTRFEVLSTSPLTVNSMARGSYYYVHSLYCYMVYFAVLVIVVLSNRNLPRAYRRGSQFMYLALVVFFVCAVVEMAGLDKKSPMDVYLMGVGLAGAFFYLATYAQGSRDYQYIKKSEVFNYLDQGIFILDRDGRMVEANRPARLLLRLLGQTKMHYGFFKEFINGQIAKGRVQRRQPEHSQDHDLYVLNSSYPVVYSVRTQPFYDYSGVPGGHLVVLSDVTNNRLFMDRLREVAGADTLTGLPNRYSYQALLRRLDKPAHLPLSVIAGDVNNLKAVNDSLGHYEGDILLKGIADALKASCPRGGTVCRIGGDEFMMLLPGYSRDQANEVMFRIYSRLALSDKEALRSAIALGCATKTEPGMNINALIALADRRMYDAKH